MRRVSLLIAACWTAMACAGEEPLPVAPPPPPPPALPTFVVFGTVQDEAGAPLPGATADDVTGGRSDITDDNGYFSFTGVRGPLTVRVRKDGYETFSQYLASVSGDIALNIRMFRVLEIVLGSTIHAMVDWSMPPCDPIRWDAQAPCRRFEFTAPFSGTLVLSISWAGGSELDATMVRNDDYIATSTSVGLETVAMSAFVMAGVTYEIRVNSYYGSQVFDLRADLTQ